MSDARSIAEHGLIGDLRTAALVDTAGTVDWLCVPRFDSPSVFGSRLDPDAGSWTLAPSSGPAKTQQFYFPDTNVLVTRHSTTGGVVELQDFMPVPESEERRGLIRRVECVRGKADLRTAVRPRFDCGRQAVEPERHGDALTFWAHDGLALTLCATVPVEDDASASFSVTSGDVVTFALWLGEETHAVGSELFEDTVAFWRRWLEGSSYRGRWRERVNR